MKFRHTVAFSFVLLAVFIVLDMTGVTQGVPDFVIEIAMILPCLAFIAFYLKRQ